MTNRLEALPSELLDQIFAQVDRSYRLHLQPSYGCWLKTLTSISWASPLLRATATPLLYRVFWIDGQSKPIRLFLRTLCEQPDLARYIEDLQLSVNQQPTSKPTDEEQDAFSAALRCLSGTPGLFQLQFALSQGCHVAESILLFALVSRIQHLRLNLAPRDNLKEDDVLCKHCPIMNDWISYILSPASPISYPNLRTVELIGRPALPVETRIEDTLLVNTMQLPNLQSLTITNYRHSGTNWDSWIGLSTLSELIIKNCDLESNSLAQILSHCRALQTLKIDWNGWSTDLHVNGSHLSTTLAAHYHTLETLHLTANSRSGKIFLFLPAFQNLHHFSALHTLEIDEHLLASGTDPWLRELPSDFPSSLVNLTIHTHFSLDRLHTLTLLLTDRCPTALTHLRFQFPVSRRDMAFVELLRGLKGVYREEGRRRWSFFLSERDDWNPCLEFVVKRGEGKGGMAVAKKLGKLVGVLEESGIDGALEEMVPMVDERRGQ